MKITVSNKDKSIVKIANNAIEAKLMVDQLSRVFDEEFKIYVVLNSEDDLWSRNFDK